jgi:hypothetical protein
VLRQVAEALVDPSIDWAVVEVAVAAAFELAPDEAFDRSHERALLGVAPAA